MPVEVETQVDVPELPDDPTMREVVRHGLAVPAAELVVRLPAVRLDDDVEDVHQARVAIRRIRSRLRTFRPFTDARSATELGEGLGSLGRVLGEVRDLDVLTGIVASSPFDGPGMVELLAAVETERHGALARLVDALDDPSCALLLDRLVEYVGDPALAPQADDPAGPVVAGLVRRPWRRLRKAVRALPDDSTADELHRVRIRAKRARYAAEAVGSVVGRDARRFAKRLAEVQDELGHVNDAAVVTARLDVLAAELTHRGAFSAGAVCGVLTDRAARRRSAWADPWRRAERSAGWIG